MKQVLLRLKENDAMSKDRVLSHQHARQLTEEEFNQVGGAYLTNKSGDCTFDPVHFTTVSTN